MLSRMAVLVATASALGVTTRAPLSRKLTQRLATVAEPLVNHFQQKQPPNKRSVSEETTRPSDAKEKRKKKPKVMFCLGGPGAGKGTQCDRLKAEFGYVHLSAGELLRRERAAGSEDGELIESYLREGKIVPVAISLSLLKREMEQSESSHFVVDGFPRNLDNVDGWNDLMRDVATVDCVLFYDVPPDVLLERMLVRGETSGRSDDNLSAAHKRLATYSESTLPLIEQFERDGPFKVIRIPGIGSIDEVWALTQDALKAYLPKVDLGPKVDVTEAASSSAAEAADDDASSSEEQRRTSSSSSSEEQEQRPDDDDDDEPPIISEDQSAAASFL